MLLPAPYLNLLEAAKRSGAAALLMHHLPSVKDYHHAGELCMILRVLPGRRPARRAPRTSRVNLAPHQRARRGRRIMHGHTSP